MSKQEDQPWALITGGARRMGRAMALHLAGKKYNIALHFHKSRQPAMELQREITQQDVFCEIFECDLMDSEAVIDLMENARNNLRRIEVLINNASIFENYTFMETDLATLENNLQIHLKTPFLLMREFGRFSQEGVIINMLDTRIRHPRKSYFAYTLSKQSLLNLTELGALTLAPKIRVNAIAPGLILPPEGKDEAYLHTFFDRVPLKRSGALLEINQALDFFIENEYITGQVIYVDGGEHI